MRISDWSSDVCSSDLLKSCQNVFKLAALGRLERLGLQLLKRSHAQFDKQRPRHFIVGKKGAVTCLDIPHGGFRQGGHEPAGNAPGQCLYRNADRFPALAYEGADQVRLADVWPWGRAGR